MSKVLKQRERAYTERYIDRIYEKKWYCLIVLVLGLRYNERILQMVWGLINRWFAQPKDQWDLGGGRGAWPTWWVSDGVSTHSSFAFSLLWIKFDILWYSQGPFCISEFSLHLLFEARNPFCHQEGSPCCLWLHLSTLFISSFVDCCIFMVCHIHSTEFGFCCTSQFGSFFGLIGKLGLFGLWYDSYICSEFCLLL